MKRTDKEGLPYIGDNIRAFRHKMNLSQMQLAKAAGLNWATIAHSEIGDIPNPKITTLMKLVKVFGITIDELIQPPKEA